MEKQSLEPCNRGQTRNALSSLLVAVILCALLAQGLSCIAIFVQSISLKSGDTLAIAIQSPSTPAAESELSKSGPNRTDIATTPIAPNFPTQSVFIPQTEAPSSPTPPDPAIVQTDELYWEDDSFESGWNPDPAPQKPAKPTKKSPDPALEKKREAERISRLQKQIAKSAQVISRHTPNYPSSARRKGLEGRVIVTVTISASGKVISPRVTTSCPHSVLNSAALEAAKRFRFKPARNGLGQSVATSVALPFTFQLNN